METERRTQRRKLYNVSTEFLYKNAWKQHVFEKKIVPHEDMVDFYTLADGIVWKSASLLWWLEYYDKICEKTDQVYCIGTFPAYMFFKTTAYGDVDLFIYCSCQTRDEILLSLIELDIRNAKKYEDVPSEQYRYVWPKMFTRCGPELMNVANQCWFKYYGFYGPSWLRPCTLNLYFVEKFRPEKNVTLEVLRVLKGCLFDLSKIALKDMSLVSASWNSAEKTSRLLSCKMVVLSKGEFPKKPDRKEYISRYPQRQPFSGIYRYVMARSKYGQHQGRIKEGCTLLQPCSLRLMSWEVCRARMELADLEMYCCGICGRVECFSFLPI